VWDESLCCDPKAGAIEVEQLEAIAALVGEDEKGVPGGDCAKLVFS